ncbi:hypothetical protein BN1723_015562, partial [Verticillium longisporum]
MVVPSASLASGTDAEMASVAHSDDDTMNVVGSRRNKSQRQQDEAHESVTSGVEGLLMTPGPKSLKPHQLNPMPTTTAGDQLYNPSTYCGTDEYPAHQQQHERHAARLSPTMRLIYAKTYELHEFFAGDVPPYAILSHTWADDEVTYHDIKNITSWAKPKQGFPKIQWACQEATVKGIDYVWVDTCCIYKSSSAELSEAINSMYQWYRDAQVCYAYLEDFPAQEKPAKAVEPGQVRKVDYTVFRQCRWFTRGWTLQE